jgi:hypothetical protein
MSNIELANQIQYLKDNNYLIVPNLHVLPQLQSLFTAFIGGLFFTGTIGLGIISITLFVTWFWIHITQKNMIFFIMLLLQWAIAIYYANSNGYCAFTLYLCIMLPALFVINILISKKKSIQLIPNPKLFWSLPVLFMLFICYSTDRSVSFLSIRDYLLLSNDLGHCLNDLYYRYTLYPGEVIKPFALKQQKTCYIHLEKNGAKRYINAVERKCILYDYLPIPDPKKANVILNIDPPHIYFQKRGRTVVKSDIMHFLRDTKSVLSDFSTKTDVNDFFRMCILLSLVISAPILIYLIIMRALFGLVCFTRIPAIVSQWLVVGIMCIWIGLVILQLPQKFPENATQKDWQSAFTKAYQKLDWRQAVILLRSTQLTRTQNEHQLALKWLHQTEHPVLKYWLIRYLCESKFSIDNNVFLKYLSDPNVNVICQALYALGQQHDRTLFSSIKAFIADCPHWYVQMYAYRSLKRLGWRNTTNQGSD